METFVEREIAHVARVMSPSLVGGARGPILSAQYWRGRLHRLLDAPHLTRGEFCALDSLLLQLGEYEASFKGQSPVTEESPSGATPPEAPPCMEPRRELVRSETDL